MTSATPSETRDTPTPPATSENHERIGDLLHHPGAEAGDDAGPHRGLPQSRAGRRRDGDEVVVSEIGEFDGRVTGPRVVGGQGDAEWFAGDQPAAQPR